MMTLKRLSSLFFALMLLIPLGAPAESISAVTASDAVNESVIIPGTVTTGSPASYWETPMDITDGAAVWAMLTAPITVVKGDQKKQTFLYKEPDKNSERVADITFDSQGLHVLETRNDGWTLVEAYSSSFHDSKIKA